VKDMARNIVARSTRMNTVSTLEVTNMERNTPPKQQTTTVSMEKNNMVRSMGKRR